MPNDHQYARAMDSKFDCARRVLEVSYIIKLKLPTNARWYINDANALEISTATYLRLRSAPELCAVPTMF